jgi:hypothetical protein
MALLSKFEVNYSGEPATGQFPKKEIIKEKLLLFLHKHNDSVKV